ncbi:MAG: plastocyanin/azurin family copper-binding protein [Dehalococcoidales bacterium]|nr:plastocyanin/azurin family copper-binding protein [Dehalococcoidales bacterium]
MGEKRRLIYSTIAVSLVGIVTGIFLGGGLLPSQAAQQQYDEKTITGKTELSIVHAHDDISQHAHPLITVVTITETTPHGTFHDFAAAMAPSMTSTAMAPTSSTLAPNEVWVINREFLPRTITVPVGTKVTWTNKDTEEHTVTFKNGLLNMRLTNRDAFFSYTFTEPGTFEYYCDPHPEMIGSVIVK